MEQTIREYDEHEKDVYLSVCLKQEVVLKEAKK